MLLYSKTDAPDTPIARLWYERANREHESARRRQRVIRALQGRIQQQDAEIMRLRRW